MKRFFTQKIIILACSFLLITAVSGRLHQAFYVSNASLQCKAQVVISLSDSCSILIGPEDILEGPVNQPLSSYQVGISENPNGPFRIPALVTYQDCGTWYYRLTELQTGNMCWGPLTVEDKTAPQISCAACDEKLAGILDVSDQKGQLFGFTNNPVPVPGISCGTDFYTHTDYIRFTLPATGSGKYKFGLSGSQIVDSTNAVNRLVLALYDAAPDPAHSCTHLLLTDGQSLDGTPETVNGHFNEVKLTPGDTYWLGVQMPGQALDPSVALSVNWGISIIDLVTGQNALTPTDSCRITCSDKVALADYVSKGQIGKIQKLGIKTPVISGSYCGDSLLYTVKIKQDSSTACGGYLILQWSLTESCGATSVIDCKVHIVPSVLKDVVMPAGVHHALKLPCMNYVIPEEIALSYGIPAAYPHFRDAAGSTTPIDKTCNFSAIYDDTEVDNCLPGCYGSRRILRKWKIVDLCSGKSVEETQIINIVDQEAPLFALRDTVISTPSNKCMAQLHLPSPSDLTDNCDATPAYEIVSAAAITITFDVSRGLWKTPELSPGKYTFTYRVYDCCGNVNVKSMKVSVVDKTVPVCVIKQDITVSLVPGGSDGSGQAKLFADALDGGSYDNCDIIRKEIRRVSNAGCSGNNVGNNGHNNNSTFSNSPLPGYYNSANDTDGGQFVKFCCQDLDPVQGYGLVRVELRVWDDGNHNGIAGDIVQGVADNYSVSWVDVRVETKIPPVITCPPNITIACYTQEGKHPDKTGYPSVYGVCGTTDIRHWDREVLDQCNNGYIDRTFLATNNGQTVKCVQRITVQKDTATTPWVFIPSSLSEEPVATGCNGPTSAQILADGPVYTAGACDIIGVSTNIIQTDNQGSVYRKWQVEYRYVNFCTKEERGPFLKNFVFRDTIAPVAVCVQLSTVLLQDPDGSGPLKPLVELWAIDFMNKSYDNCTDADDLIYTFEALPPQVTLKNDGAGNPMSIDHPHFFNANGGVASAVNPNTSVYKVALTQYQLGKLQLWIPSTRSSAKIWMSDEQNPDSIQCVEVHVTVWDEAYNHNNCITMLKLLKGPNYCEQFISGNVCAPDGRPVSNVFINIDADMTEFPQSTVTNNFGDYTFSVACENEYTISAYKSGAFLNGVSTLDMIMIQRHVLGIQKLDGVYRRIAADITNDAKITAADIIELKKLILGTIPAFTKNASWRFPVKSQTLNPENPFPFLESITMTLDSTSLPMQNFVAVKIGDVSGNATVNLSGSEIENRSRKDFALEISDQLVSKGETIDIPVRAAHFSELAGFQCAVNLGGLTFEGIFAGSLELDDTDIAVHKNPLVAMSFASRENRRVEEGEILFTLRCKADRTDRLSNLISINTDVLQAEYYDHILNTGSLMLDFIESGDNDFRLFQNEPNPFEDQTSISFYSPADAKVSLIISDITGKVLIVRNLDAVKGMNTEVFTKAQMGTAGMLYFTLTCGEFAATRKMIVVE
jgi:hypothetical protein